MIIRKAEKQDMDEVMDIWLQGNLEAHDFVSPEYWKQNFDMVRELMPESELYVAETDGIVCGFLGMQEHYIAGLFVKKEYRKRGVGKALLDQMKAFRTHLCLSVYENNYRAVEFYKKSGFGIQNVQIDEATGQTEYEMVWSR